MIMRAILIMQNCKPETAYFSGFTKIFPLIKFKLLYVNISHVTFSDCYDGVMVIGVIMPGGAPETCFPELIRVAKPGKYIYGK